MIAVNRRTFLAYILIFMLGLLSAGCLGPVYGIYELTKEKPKDDAPFVNRAPVTTVVTPLRADAIDSSSIPIEFTISDADAQNCDVTIWYDDNDGGWTACASITGTLTGLTPGGGPYTVQWDAATDLLDAGTKVNMQVGITANDGVEDSLRAESTAFIAGNDLPAIVITVPADGQGNIVIDYTLADLAGDDCDVLFQYGLFGTGPWFDCTPASVVAVNPVIGITTSPVPTGQSFTWDSAVDLAGQQANVFLQLSVDDGGGTPSVETAGTSFQVNNNSVPSVTFLSGQAFLQDTFGIIILPFRIKDEEEDICSVSVGYSVDGQAAVPCTVYDSAQSATTGLTSYWLDGDKPLGSHRFAWNSLADVGHRDVVCDLTITATDSVGNTSAEVLQSVLLQNFTRSHRGYNDSLPSGALPSNFADGDVNGDGYSDLAVTNLGADSVDVFRGGPGGLQSAPDTIATGMWPDRIIMADLNNDGFEDVISANRGDDTVTVTMGSAAGPLAPNTMAVEVYPNLMSKGDLNDDGFEDVVISNRNSDSVSVLLGGPAGVIAPEAPITVGDTPSGLSIGYINNDAYADIIVSSSGAAVTDFVYIPGGDPFTGIPASIPAGGRSYYAAVADIDRDGFDDALMLSDARDEVLIFSGSAGGPVAPATPYSMGAWLSTILVTDSNADTWPDLFVGASSDFSYFARLGSSTGLGGALTIAANEEPGYLVDADHNGDGCMDVAVRHSSSATHILQLGHPDLFQESTPILDRSGMFGYHMADVNGDGLAEIFGADSDLSEIIWAQGSAGGPEVQEVWKDAKGPEDLCVGDFDGNGYPDVAYYDSVDNELFIKMGVAAGWTEPTPISAGPDGIQHLEAGDFTGDGYDDAFFHFSNTNDLHLFPGGPVGLTAAGAPLALPYNQDEIVFGDLDGNGCLDAIMNDASLDKLMVIMCTPAGLPAGVTELDSVGWPLGVAVADLNGDGYDELISSNSGSNELHIYAGDPTGPLTPATIYPVVDVTKYLTSGDFNGDGFTDVAMSSTATDEVIEMQGSKDGPLTPRPPIAAVNNPTSLVSADINGDGFDDVIALRSSRDAIEFFAGSVAGLQPGIETSVAANTRFVRVLDMNGDGYPDMACVATNSNVIDWLAGGSNGPAAQRQIAAGQSPFYNQVRDINGDSADDLIVIAANSYEARIIYGDSLCHSLTRTVAAGGLPAELRLGSAALDLPAGALSTDTRITLFRGKGNLPIAREVGAGTPWARPVPATMAWDVMPHSATFGAGVTLTLPMRPGLSGEILLWAEYRLYRYDWTGDPVEIATTEGGAPTLVVDPAAGIAYTQNTGDILAGGRYQIVRLTGDLDGDGLPDSWETYYFGNPATQDGTGTAGDGDTLDNLTEYLAGTSPVLDDTDGDGYADDTEIGWGFDPLDARSINRDGDNDQIGDEWEFDNFGDTTSNLGADNPDGDPYDNTAEWINGTNPLVPDP